MKRFAILLLFVGLRLLAGAQTSPTIDTIHITGICKYRTNNDINVAVGDYVMVKMSKNMLEKAEKQRTNLRLWMNGVCLDKTAPLYANHKASAMVFLLQRDTSKGSPWRTLYNFKLKQEVTFSLGTNTTEFGKHRFTLFIMTSNMWFRGIAIVLMVALVVILYYFRRRWFRDTGLYTKAGVVIGFGKEEPTSVADGRINISEITYSLARFQFVIWFSMVFCSLVYIWGFSGVMMTPSGTALILLTISATTLLAGKMLDNAPPAQVPDPNNPGGPMIEPTPQMIVQDFIDRKRGTKDFFTDLLCDGASISIHRLQLLLFTAFLSIYFIIEVFTTFTMPEFDDTMLILMGVSGGTYVGLKATEK